MNTEIFSRLNDLRYLLLLCFWIVSALIATHSSISITRIVSRRIRYTQRDDFDSNCMSLQYSRTVARIVR
jgi:hypothetical protein